MARRCPTAVVLGAGNVGGYALEFGHYSKNWGGGVASITPSAVDEVWGVLFEVDESCIRALDAFEGYPRVYTRKLLQVRLLADSYDAWIYVLANRHDQSPPSPAYLGVILEACTRFGFPQRYREAVVRAAVPAA